MVFASPLTKDMLTFAMRAKQDWGEIMGQEPCVSLATEAQTWLGKVATQEDVTKTVVPVSPRAIEDASLRLAMTYHASVPQKI